MLEEKVLGFIKENNLINDGDKIVLGVSGGPDSMTMLNILNNISVNEIINFQIVVCHINHMIREEAVLDEEYVCKFCNKNNIEFYSLRADVETIAKNEKIGTEEAGRKVRYEFFEKVLDKTNSNKIATAHTANDNAETVLMNIIRGSGISGLKGIEKIRDGKFIRPIIECSRDEIENYCKENNLNPRIDKTNMENIYTRNKVRNLLIPYIQENFNPNLVQSLNRLSSLAQEQNEFVESKIKEAYEECLIEEKEESEIVLDLKKFNNKEKTIKSGVIIEVYKKLFGSSQGIEKIHINDIVKLCQNNIGNKFLIPNKKIKVYVNHGRVNFITQNLQKKY